MLTWVNYKSNDPTSLPTLHGPTTPITPDPQPHEGPHEYQGVWAPWMDTKQDKQHYPTNYAGPGYPPGRRVEL